METPILLDTLHVVDTFDVMSPLSTPERPIKFKNACGVVLADGSKRYACNVCPPSYVQTFSGIGYLRAHISREHGDGAKKAAAVKKTAAPKAPPAKSTTRKPAQKATPPVEKTPLEKLAATAAYGKTTPPVETVETSAGTIEIVTTHDAVSPYPTDLEDIELDGFLAQINGLARNRDAWRERALKAEAELAAMKEKNRRLSTMKAILNQMRRELDALEEIE